MALGKRIYSEYVRVIFAKTPPPPPPIGVCLDKKKIGVALIAILYVLS